MHFLSHFAIIIIIITITYCFSINPQLTFSELQKEPAKTCLFANIKLSSC